MTPSGNGQLGNTRGHQLSTTGAASAPAAPITAADQERIDQALRDARASNTRRQYSSAWRAWSAWCADHGHQAMPADPAAVAAYLAERTEQGAAAATVRTIRAAIGAAHRDAGADDPTAHDGVRRVLAGPRPPGCRTRAWSGAGPHRRGLRRHPRNGQHPAAHRARGGE